MFAPSLLKKSINMKTRETIITIQESTKGKNAAGVNGKAEKGLIKSIKLQKAQTDVYDKIFLPELKQAKRSERAAKKYAKKYAKRK